MALPNSMHTVELQVRTKTHTCFKEAPANSKTLSTGNNILSPSDLKKFHSMANPPNFIQLIERLHQHKIE